jgi:hypothetical protein
MKKVTMSSMTLTVKIIEPISKVLPASLNRELNASASIIYFIKIIGFSHNNATRRSLKK